MTLANLELGRWIDVGGVAARPLDGGRGAPVPPVPGSRLRVTDCAIWWRGLPGPATGYRPGS